MRPGYFIKKAFSGMRNALFVNLLAATTIALSLILVGGFIVIFVNANNLANRLGGRLDVVVYLKDNIKESSFPAIEEEIKKLPEVKGTRYISKEEAFRSFKKELADEPSVLDGIEGNPLPASIVVKINENFRNTEGIKGLVGKLKGKDFVDDLQYSGEWVERFSLLISLVEFGGAAIGAGLIITTMLIVSNTIRLTMYTRLDEIEVMRMVGATSSFINAPFVVEGIFLGFAGAVSASLVLFAGGYLIEYNFGSAVKLLLGSNIDLIPLEAVMAVFVLGLAYGLLGSLLSLWRLVRN